MQHHATFANIPARELVARATLAPPATTALLHPIPHPSTRREHPRIMGLSMRTPLFAILLCALLAVTSTASAQSRPTSRPRGPATTQGMKQDPQTGQWFTPMNHAEYAFG